MDSQLERAVEIVSKLEEWLEGVDGLSSCPQAHLRWSTWTLDINISGIVLWCNQADGDDELMLEEIKRRYIDEVEQLAISARLIKWEPEPQHEETNQ